MLINVIHYLFLLIFATLLNKKYQKRPAPVIDVYCLIKSLIKITKECDLEHTFEGYHCAKMD